MGGILPVQLTLSESFEWHCEAPVLTCLSVGYRQLIRTNTAAEHILLRGFHSSLHNTSES